MFGQYTFILIFSDNNDKLVDTKNIKVVETTCKTILFKS